jgi:FkbM family methyltransferase
MKCRWHCRFWIYGGVISATALAIDCGANIGVQAKHMTDWGSVLAVETQERIYYALIGNIAINNCFNAVALNAAISDALGKLKIPGPD